MNTQELIEAAVLCVLCERFNGRGGLTVKELHEAAKDAARLALTSISPLS